MAKAASWTDPTRALDLLPLCPDPLRVFQMVNLRARVAGAVRCPGLS